MARWKSPQPAATFEDVPSDLTGQERAEWLEAHGLALVDYLAWLRAQDPLAHRRPPARRKLLTARERAELDLELEKEGWRW
jgi:hypothetical protein